MSAYNEALVTSSPKTKMEQMYHTSCLWLSEFGEHVASGRVGQFLFRKTDDLLWTVEKSTLWSVEPPVEEQQEKTPLEKTDETTQSTGPIGSNKRSTGAMIRPLPWLIFIPLLVLIRVARVGLGAASRLCGKEPPKPKDMVRYIQTLRRRLRVLRFRGMRNIKGKEGSNARPEARSISAFSTLRSLLPALLAGASVNGGKMSTEDKKRKFTEVDGNSVNGDEETDETIKDLMERNVDEDEDSDNDPDFEPNFSLDVNSEGSFTSSSEDYEDDVRQTHGMKRQLSRPTSILSADIIQEESEDSSTLSVSTADDEVADEIEKATQVLDAMSSYLDKLQPLDGEDTRTEGEEGRTEDLVDNVVPTKTAESLEDAPVVDDLVVSNSDCDAISLSLSTGSGDTTSSVTSAIDISDRSHDSAIQKMSSLFSINKKTPKNSV